IVLAGDGTLLVADDDLPDPVPFRDALVVGDPLRLAAEALLAGDTPHSDVTVRRVAATRTRIAAFEIAVASNGHRPLPMGGWLWPEHRGHLDWSPELAAIHGYGDDQGLGDVSEYAASLL